MNYHRFADGRVFYKGQEWPQVFFHYSGFNVGVKDGILTFRHTMYLTPTIRKTFVEPYAELTKVVFAHYLNTPINEVVITPLNRWNYAAKTITHYLNKLLPIDWAIAQVMKVKYREKQKLYSDK